jgi:hypothetical protein
VLHLEQVGPHNRCSICGAGSGLRFWSEFGSVGLDLGLGSGCLRLRMGRIWVKIGLGMGASRFFERSVLGLQISALQSAGLRVSGSEGLRVWVGRSFCLVGMVNIHLGSEGLKVRGPKGLRV